MDGRGGLFDALDDASTRWTWHVLRGRVGRFDEKGLDRINRIYRMGDRERILFLILFILSKKTGSLFNLSVHPVSNPVDGLTAR